MPSMWSEENTLVGRRRGEPVLRRWKIVENQQTYIVWGGVAQGVSGVNVSASNILEKSWAFT